MAGRVSLASRFGRASKVIIASIAGRAGRDGRSGRAGSASGGSWCER